MSVGNLPKYVGTEPFPEFHHPLLMAGGAEMKALAGEGQKIFMVAIPAHFTRAKTWCRSPHSR
jgi:hypothetical protein